VTAHYNPLDISRSPLAAEVARVNAMEEAWDEAAEALKRFDLIGCDEALARFRAIHAQSDTREEMKG
jgi:hypothetical protein